jgi:hypothetical protein
VRAVLVASAHLDDAVLSCGQFLGGRPGVTVAGTSQLSVVSR